MRRPAEISMNTVGGSGGREKTRGEGRVFSIGDETGDFTANDSRSGETRGEGSQDASGVARNRNKYVRPGIETPTSFSRATFRHCYSREIIPLSLFLSLSSNSLYQSMSIFIYAILYSTCHAIYNILRSTSRAQPYEKLINTYTRLIYWL